LARGIVQPSRNLFNIAFPANERGILAWQVMSNPVLLCHFVNSLQLSIGSDDIASNGWRPATIDLPMIA
jgi:hypothetical protein